LFEIESINKYLIGIKDMYRYNTIIKKRAILQRIIRSMLSRNDIELSKIPVIYDKKPKYVMSSVEVENYLMEQKRLNFENYVIQKLFIQTGCRINATIYLKLKHLEFKNNVYSKEVFLPDRKTGTYRKF
jgi:integrase